MPTPEDARDYLYFSNQLIDSASSSILFTLFIAILVFCLLMYLIHKYMDSSNIRKWLSVTSGGLALCSAIAFFFLIIIGFFTPNINANEEVKNAIEHIEEIPNNQLKQYLGQLFIIGDNGLFNENAKDSIMYDLASQNMIGGILINSVNLNFKANLTSTIGSVKDYIIDLNSSTKLPLFISTDHEGGNTSALSSRKILNELPSPMMLSATRQSSLAKKIGEISSLELSSLGINLNLSPVLDVNTNKENDLIRDRSYGGNSKIVSAMSEQYINGASNKGLYLVAKHYPGHGNTREGFHTTGIPHSTQNNKAFTSSLRPFRDALSNNNSIGVMTSHVEMTISTEKFNNVSLSKKIVSDLLKTSREVKIGNTKANGLNFNGIVFSDDLTSPSATSKRYKCEENKRNYLSNIYDVLIKSFESGHDVFILSNVLNTRIISKDKCSYSSITRKDYEEIYNKFKNYVFNSEFNYRQNMVRKSIIKVLKAKSKIKHLLDYSRSDINDLEKSISKNKEIIKSITKKAITHIQDNGFKLSTDDKVLIVPFINHDYKYIDNIYRKKTISKFENKIKLDSPFSYYFYINDRARKPTIHAEKSNIFFSEMIPQSKRLFKKIIKEQPDKLIFHVNSRSSWLFTQTYFSLYHEKHNMEDILIIFATSPTLMNLNIEKIISDLNPTKKERNKIISSSIMVKQFYDASILITYSNYGLADEIVADSLLTNNFTQNNAEPAVRIAEFYPDLDTYIPGPKVN